MRVVDVADIVKKTLFVLDFAVTPHPKVEDEIIVCAKLNAAPGDVVCFKAQSDNLVRALSKVKDALPVVTVITSRRDKLFCDSPLRVSLTAYAADKARYGLRDFRARYKK